MCSCPEANIAQGYLRLLSHMEPLSQLFADLKKNHPTHTTTFVNHYWGPRTSMPNDLGDVVTITTTASVTTLSLSPATQTPRAPDQQEDVQSSFKRSIPLIIYMTATIGGIVLIIIMGMLGRKWLKTRKSGKQEEHHEQWLARQNLDREEHRVSRMAFGGYFGRFEGIQGRDFASEDGAGGRDYRDWGGMELRPMARDRQWP